MSDVFELIQRLAVFVLYVGPYLSLRGVTIPNEGYVLAMDINFGDTGLHCYTDRSDCCSASDGAAQGHWYRPDWTQVGSFTQEKTNDPSTNFFSRDRTTGVVRLNRRGNPPQRGRFRCEIPNADGTLVNLYVNIGEYKINAKATPSGIPVSDQGFPKRACRQACGFRHYVIIYAC